MKNAITLLLVAALASACAGAPAPVAPEGPVFADFPAFVESYLSHADELGITEECLQAPMDSPVEIWPVADLTEKYSRAPGRYVYGMSLDDTYDSIIIGEAPEVSSHAHDLSEQAQLVVAAHEAAHVAFRCMGIDSVAEQHEIMERSGLEFSAE